MISLPSSVVSTSLAVCVFCLESTVAFIDLTCLALGNSSGEGSFSSTTSSAGGAFAGAGSDFFLAGFLATGFLGAAFLALAFLDSACLASSFLALSITSSKRASSALTSASVNLPPRPLSLPFMFLALALLLSMFLTMPSNLTPPRLSFQFSSMSIIL